MSESQQPAPEAPMPPTEIPVDMVKSGLFRVVHADGAWFTASPDKFMHCVFYNERIPIPTRIIGKYMPDGSIVGEVEGKREARAGIYRELEVDIVMSLQAAEKIHAILGQNIALFKTWK